MTVSEPVPGDQSEDHALREANDFVDRMSKSPAISCPFKFSWAGDEEQANRAAMRVCVYAKLQQERHPWMDHSALKEVVFTNDYEQGLREAVGPAGKQPEPTKEAGGFSVGMLVKVADGSKLVMQEGVAHALLSENSEHQDFAMSVIRHELCHVHDESFKRALIESGGIKYARSELESRFLPMAESMWAEYFANKYSHGPWSDTRSDFVLVHDAVHFVRSELFKAILTYRTSGNQLGVLLAVAEPKIRFLAQCFGYALGRLAGLDQTLDEHDEDLAALLEKTDLRPAWDAAARGLDALDARRPGWGAYWDICELNPICADMMKACGLVYRLKGEGVYVDVPFTKETTPVHGLATRLGSVFHDFDYGIGKVMRDLVSASQTLQQVRDPDDKARS